MSSALLDAWKALPQAKQMQLARAYGIRWYGISEEDLESDLRGKMPPSLVASLTPTVASVIKDTVPTDDQLRKAVEVLKDQKPLDIVADEKPHLASRSKAFVYKKVQVYEVIDGEHMGFEFFIGDSPFIYIFVEEERAKVIKVVKAEIKKLLEEGKG